MGWTNDFPHGRLLFLKCLAFFAVLSFLKLPVKRAKTCPGCPAQPGGNWTHSEALWRGGTFHQLGYPSEKSRWPARRRALYQRAPARAAQARKWKLIWRHIWSWKFVMKYTVSMYLLPSCSRVLDILWGHPPKISGIPLVIADTSETPVLLPPIVPKVIENKVEEWHQSGDGHGWADFVRIYIGKLGL